MRVYDTFGRLQRSGTPGRSGIGATITGTNTSVNVAVSGFTAANNVQVEQTESTAGFTPRWVVKNSGSFDIVVPSPPEDVGAGLVFVFDYLIN